MTTYDLWSLIAQYLIFVATIIYAGVAIYQLRAINTQAKIAKVTLKATRIAANAARKSAHVAERALYDVQGASVHILEVKEREIPGGAIIPVQNAGQTTASILEESIHADLVIEDFQAIQLTNRRE